MKKLMAGVYIVIACHKHTKANVLLSAIFVLLLNHTLVDCGYINHAILVL